MNRQDIASITKQFEKIGATVKVVTRQRGRARSVAPYDLNIQRARRDGREEFVLTVTPDAPPFRVLQANGASRHLLLHAAGEHGGERFLCGHDERHWFVAAVPDRVTTITEARRSLLPQRLRGQVDGHALHTRHNDVFKRQGEWFFVPASQADVAALVGKPSLHSEPIQRGTRSKPHLVAELIRFGGQRVVLYNGREYSIPEWDELQKSPGFKPSGKMDRRVKDPEVFVRGKVRHPDHETLDLGTVWHRVLLNGELVSSTVSFYD